VLATLGRRRDHHVAAGDQGVQSFQVREMLAEALFQCCRTRHVAKGDAKWRLHEKSPGESVLALMQPP
jgi:hypothetical protein